MTIQFEASFVNDATASAGPSVGNFTMYSDAAQISAEPSCNYRLGWGRYMWLNIHNRLGLPLGSAYKAFSSYPDCENFRLQIFENPRRFIFTFSPLNYWHNREFSVEEVAKKP